MEVAPAVDADWAKPYGEKAAELGIVPEVYDLNGQISRLEFCTAAAKLLELGGETAAEFPDCTDGYVGALVAKGVISGFEDGTFRPDETLNRAQIARIIDSILSLA